MQEKINKTQKERSKFASERRANSDSKKTKQEENLLTQQLLEQCCLEFHQQELNNAISVARALLKKNWLTLLSMSKNKLQVSASLQQRTLELRTPLSDKEKKQILSFVGLVYRKNQNSLSDSQIKQSVDFFRIKNPGTITIDEIPDDLTQFVADLFSSSFTNSEQVPKGERSFLDFDQNSFEFD